MARDPSDLVAVETPELEECDRFYLYPNLTVGEAPIFLRCLDEDGDVSEELLFTHLPELLVTIARKGDGSRMWAKAHQERIRLWDLGDAAAIVTRMAPVIAAIGEGIRKKTSPQPKESSGQSASTST